MSATDWGLNLIREIKSKRSTMVYFDYLHGIDVEYIASGPDVNTMQRTIAVRDKDDPNEITISYRKEGESSDVMFVQISLVE